MEIDKNELTRLMKPDTYLLYETRPNMPSNTNIRFALEITEEVNGEALNEAANAAIKRYPYFSVRVNVKDGSYIFEYNPLPIVVSETVYPSPALGSKEANYHLNAIDYEDNTIYFNISHSIADAAGYIPFIKSVLYQYLIRTHKESISAEGIRLPDSDFLPGEFDFPELSKLPEPDFVVNTNNKMGYFPAGDYIYAMQNPHPKNDGCYCINLKQRELMKYVHSNDASPVAIIAVFMFKALAPLCPAEEDTFSAGIACNFRKAVNCPNAFHSLSRPLHARFKRSYLDLPVDKLGTVTRGMIMLQSQPENSVIHARNLLGHYSAVDAFNTLNEKKNYCLNQGMYAKGCRDTYNVSYVGQTDFGDMNKYVKSLHTLSFGHLLIEINAVGDMFYISFNQILRTDKYINAFLNVLDEANLSYSVSNYKPKNISTSELP